MQVPLKSHIFLCCTPRQAKCCSYEQGQESWTFLKKRMQELDLTLARGFYRTKADCLRICQKGPIAVIYPEGIWYFNCMPSVLERILTEHILQKNIVAEYRIVTQPFPP